MKPDPLLSTENAHKLLLHNTCFHLTVEISQFDICTDYLLFCASPANYCYYQLLNILKTLSHQFHVIDFGGVYITICILSESPKKSMFLDETF